MRVSPLTLALLGVLAYRTYQGKGRLADMLGSGESAGGKAPGGPARGNTAGGMGGGFGDLLKGGLGGLLGGGAAGGILSGGLQDLLKQFQQNGQGDKAETWVSKGPNKPVSPQELEKALGSERVDWLMEQTGMSREELLAGLSRELPETVDKLTPEGRLPTEQEAERVVRSMPREPAHGSA
jgi:uncharacterized protein YidB (DUF937 family)